MRGRARTFPLVLGMALGAALLIVLVTAVIATPAALLIPAYAAAYTAVRWFLPQVGLPAVVRGILTLSAVLLTLAITESWFPTAGVVVLGLIIERLATPPVSQPDAPMAFRPHQRR